MLGDTGHKEHWNTFGDTRRHWTFYHGLVTFTEVTFVNIHYAQMSTLMIEMCPWYIVFVLVIENTGCGITSVSHTPNQALLRTLIMLNLGLRPSFNIRGKFGGDLISL